VEQFLRKQQEKDEGRLWGYLIPQGCREGILSKIKENPDKPFYIVMSELGFSLMRSGGTDDEALAQLEEIQQACKEWQERNTD